MIQKQRGISRGKLQSMSKADGGGWRMKVWVGLGTVDVGITRSRVWDGHMTERLMRNRAGGLIVPESGAVNGSRRDVGIGST
jgi:hypothetical protein